MTFDHLWAGWRSGYVASVSSEPEELEGQGTDDPSDASAAKCIFCEILASSASEKERHVVFEDELCVVLLNAFPYASGHLLVMPRRHLGGLAELTPHESAGLWAVTQQAITAIEHAYAPDGMNFGANLGRAAGAGLPAHLHLHVVPRWIGDTNFMTSIASVRVLPESLEDSWTRLKASWCP